MANEPAPFDPGTNYLGGEGAVEGSSWSTTQQAQWGFNQATANIPLETPGIGQANLRQSEMTGIPTHAQTVEQTNVSSVVQWLQGQTPELRTITQQMLKAAGYLPAKYAITGDLDKKMVAGFVDLLGESSRYSIANPGTTWQTYLGDKVNAATAAAAKTGGAAGAGGGSGAGTHTRRDVQLLTYDDPGGFHDAFTQAVGRAPTDTETRKFVDGFNAKAESHPQVTTQTVDAGGNVSSSQSGGLDVRAELQSAAQENPDYANYQAVTTYFGALEKALGTIGGA